MRNVLSATFHNRRGIRGLEGITIRQKFANHTVAFLDYRFNSKYDYLLPPENSPVAARWGQSPTNLRTFYGYVNHYETVEVEGRALTRMVLLGTSKVMNTSTPNSWAGTTRSNIAREIAARHRLASVVHDHPYIVENWATGTRSDWQALKALADEAGYRLWVDGGTLWMMDPTKALRTASSMTTPVVRRREVRDLQVLGGSYIPGEIEASSRRVQYGLDYRTNEFFEATSGDAVFPAQVVPATATTFSEAQDIADAAERKQRDQFVLKGTLSGRADLRPGSLVRVESGRVNSDQAGLWLVSAATHEITSSDFTTKIVATRGSDQYPLLRAQSTVRGAAGLTQAVVRDGVTWEAALQEHVHV